MKKGIKVQISEFSETPMEGVEHFLSIEEQEIPNENELGEDDVVVAVKSAAIGWVDLMMISGQYHHQPPLPYIPGMEYAGMVLSKGNNVDTVKVGDKVLVDGLTTGPRSPGKYQKYGGFASYTIAPKTSIYPIPSRLNFDQACNLLGNYETAYYALITTGKLKTGETILIHGASGATGMAAVHIAKLIGATVIATGRSEEKLAVVKDQGADYVINTKAINPEEKVRKFREDVKALTNGKGVDVVYDGVGGAISEESLRCMKFGARFLIVGWASTPFVAKGKGQRGAPNVNYLPTNLILLKGLKVLGSPMVIGTQKNPAIRAERLQTIFQWVEEGKITPYISHTFPLKNIKEAMRTKWSGKVIGGAVVKMEE